jgi:hypothetical protein
MSDDESSEEIDLQGDVKSIQSLIASMMLVCDDLMTKFQKMDKPGISKANIIQEGITSSSTVIRLLSIAMKKSIRIANQSITLEEENDELERSQENHAIEQNNLESVIKVHTDDKKLLVPLVFENVAYHSFMSLRQGGDTTCSTCLEDFKENEEISILQCKHFFHTTCAIKWLSENKSACSLCKRHITHPSGCGGGGGRKRPRSAQVLGQNQNEMLSVIPISSFSERGEASSVLTGGTGGSKVEEK